MSHSRLQREAVAMCRTPPFGSRTSFCKRTTGRCMHDDDQSDDAELLDALATEDGLPDVEKTSWRHWTRSSSRRRWRQCTSTASWRPTWLPSRARSVPRV